MQMYSFFSFRVVIAGMIRLDRPSFTVFGGSREFSCAMHIFYQVDSISMGTFQLYPHPLFPLKVGSKDWAFITLSGLSHTICDKNGRGKKTVGGENVRRRER